MREHTVMKVGQAFFVAAFLASCILSQNSFATPSSELSPEENRSSNLLAKELAKQIRTTNRKFYTYHYEKAVRPSTPKTEAEDPFAHVRSWSEYFFDPSQNEGAAKGFYLATDPIASRSFGDTLYRIELPVGLSYLNLRGEDGLENSNYKMPANLRQALLNAGCNAPDMYFLIRQNRCPRIARDALKKLKVDAIAYSWDTVDFEFCSNRPHEALILLSVDKILPSSIRVFTSSVPKDSDALDEAMVIQSLFRSAIPSEYVPKPEKRSLWPEIKSVQDKDLRAWMGTHLQGCTFNSAENKSFSSDTPCTGGIGTTDKVRVPMDSILNAVKSAQ